MAVSSPARSATVRAQTVTLGCGSSLRPASPTSAKRWPVLGGLSFDSFSTTLITFVFAAVIQIGSLLNDGVIQKGQTADVGGLYIEYVFSMVVSCATCGMCLYPLVIKNPKMILVKILSVILVPCWISAAGILTWREPIGNEYAGFSKAGNGFFSVYAGMFLSIAVVGKLFFPAAGSIDFVEVATSSTDEKTGDEKVETAVA